MLTILAFALSVNGGPDPITQLVQHELYKERLTRQVLAVDAPAPPTIRTLDPKWAMLLGGAADAASTYAFLRQGTLTELNPALLFYNRAPWATIPVAVAAGFGLHTMHRLITKRSPPLANTLAALLGGYQLALAGNNVERMLDNASHDTRHIAVSAYSDAAVDLRHR